VGVSRMDDGRVRPETARVREQLDRPQAVLVQALLDLARLLVRVDVQRQRLGRGVAAGLLEPGARTGANGGGGGGAAPPAPPSRTASSCDRYSATDAWRKRSIPPRPYAESRSTSSIPASAAASTAACASASPR